LIIFIKQLLTALNCKEELEDWQSQECQLTPTLTFDLLTSNTDPDPDKNPGSGFATKI